MQGRSSIPSMEDPKLRKAILYNATTFEQLENLLFSAQMTSRTYPLVQKTHKSRISLMKTHS